MAASVAATPRPRSHRASAGTGVLRRAECRADSQVGARGTGDLRALPGRLQPRHCGPDPAGAAARLGAVRVLDPDRHHRPAPADDRTVTRGGAEDFPIPRGRRVATAAGAPAALSAYPRRGLGQTRLPLRGDKPRFPPHAAFLCERLNRVTQVRAYRRRQGWRSFRPRQRTGGSQGSSQER